jgi:phosphoglycerate dehydrogenase-like enzyme
MRKALVDLGSEFPAWSLPQAHFDALCDAFGDGWEVHNVSVNREDAVGRAQCGGQQGNIYEGAEVCLGWGIPRTVARATLGTLKWAHSGAAGVGASITSELRSSGAVLTNSRGIHAEPVSDWVVAAIGFCVRGFHEAMAAQREHRWAKGALTSSEASLTEFAGLRLGIAGLGGIGQATARKCAALGMEVRAVRRNLAVPQPGFVSWVGSPEDLTALCSASDVLVVTVPHTAATTNLVSEAALRALPRGAYLLNVSRGGILDETALLKQLDEGHIRGCVLDVFAGEPLRRDHPFWDHPRVFITPHVSGVTRHFWRREMALMVENIGHFLRGDRLRNVVDLEAGY